MAELKTLEVYAYTEEALGLYINDKQEEFEILYIRTYSRDAQTKKVELLRVERSGHPVHKADGIWKEIRANLQEGR